MARSTWISTKYAGKSERGHGDARLTCPRRNAVSGFTAEVLADNKAMRAVFNRSDLKVSSELHDRVYSFVMDFE